MRKLKSSLCIVLVCRHMEYGHRMWGRSIGAVFYVSAAAFWVKGCLNKALKKRVVVAGVLLACQGLLGKYFIGEQN